MPILSSTLINLKGTFTDTPPLKTGGLLGGFILRDRPSDIITANSPPPPVVAPPPPVSGDIALDSVLGRVRETTAVARRLENAPGIEFLNVAAQTKERFLFGGLQILDNAGFALEDIPVTGFKLADGRPIADAASLLKLSNDPKNVIVSDDTDPSTSDKPEEHNEARYFAFALGSVDATVRFLRGIETRTDEYRRMKDEASASRDRVLAAIARLQTGIDSIEAQLAETRHDLSVARSLRAEEVQRVAGIVARRREVLAEQVPYLVFRRPLFTRVLDDSPVIAAQPGLVDDPVPAAQRQTDELLPELQQMVDTLRDVPARWFLKAAPIFDRFDRMLSIGKLAGAAFDRMDAIVTKQARAIEFDPDDSSAAQQLRRTFDGHEQRVMRIAGEGRGLLASAQVATAKGALDLVRRFASVADLVRTAPPTRDVTLAAAGLLDDIGNVAQSLYEQFCDVPPATRLRWAEIFSELDPSVPLRQLTVLPDFGNEAIGVDFVLWRQMQMLVDWLFTQVDADDDAVAAINDLVRVCLLLSAHAPVKRILSARVKRPVPAVVDARLELELDPRTARIGMQVLVHASLTNVVIARGVMEDIAAEGGVARITQVMAAQQTIDGTARVQLQSGLPLSTPAKARTDQAASQPAQNARADALTQRALRGVGAVAGRRIG